MGRQGRRQTGRHVDTSASNACEGEEKFHQSEDGGLARASENTWFLQKCREGDLQVLDVASRSPPMYLPLRSGRLSDIMDEDGNNALLLAAGGGHLKLVQGLYALGFDLQVVNFHGDNALHLAAFQGHAAVVSWLENQGVGIHVAEYDSDRRDDDEGHDGVVKHHHEQTHPLDLPTSTSTWCHEALCSLFFDFVRRGDVSGLDQLVENVGRHSFRWHMTDDVRRTALHVAAESNQLGMLQLLQMKPLLSLDAVTIQRDTCLHVAVAEGHLDIVKFLTGQCSRDVIHAMNSQRWTALEMACYVGHGEITMTLLKTTSLVLSFACLALAVQGAHPSLVEKLLALPEASHYVYGTEATSGDSLLHMACAMRDGHLCSVLLDHFYSSSRDVNQPMQWVDLADRDGCNVAQLVVGLNWSEGVRVLRDHGRLSMDQVVEATTVPFFVQHAAPDLFSFTYKHLSATWQQRVFEAAIQSSRNDLVATCNRIHDDNAAAIITVASSPRPMTHSKQRTRANGVKVGRADASISTTSDPASCPAYVSQGTAAHTPPSERGERVVAHELRERSASSSTDSLQECEQVAFGDLILDVPLEDCSGDMHLRQDMVYHGMHAAWGKVLVCTRPSSQAAALERLHGQTLRQLLAHVDGHRLLHYVDASMPPHFESSATPHFLLYEHAASTWRRAFHSKPLRLSADAVAVLRNATMTHVDPHRRATIDGVRGHPFLWTGRQKLAYIETVANDMLVELQMRQHCIGACYPAPDWGAPLQARGLDVHRHRQYDTSSTIDLVRWIRNLKQHAAELSPEAWRQLQSSRDRSHDHDISIWRRQRVLEEFVQDVFPDLVLRLWKCLGPLESTDGET
ncbi:hypothetical protein DYB32_004934 [Aphanomyces invadans]|uniref:KEN domain-containing protein n=1 Tax=Aphanomyces invadans TaxID=157072 RepID=A0A3R6Z5L3_9STRA|nr:hypothetical protein DYB32_004934 [Aphanomyces invadans]